MQTVQIPIKDLKPAEYNPRKITQHDFENLKKSITEYGFVEPIVVNRDMTVIGGHQRLKAAEALKMESVSCVVLDLGKPQEKALNLALNKISGSWDDMQLAALLESMQSGIDDLVTGFDSGEVSKILAENHDLIENSELPASKQLLPCTEYIVILCKDSQDLDTLKSRLGLQVVRRGGYKIGSQFDDTDVERVIDSGRLIGYLK